jgi:transketolase
VIDCYSIKPIDSATLRAALSETGLVLTVEDHWLEGGLGDAVLAALASEGDLSGRVVKIGVTQMPGSGTPEELRDRAGISAARVAERVRELLA